MQVNVLEAKNNLSQLVSRAAAGEDVVIARRGVPLVRLVPVRADLAHGTGAAIVKWLDDHAPSGRPARPSGDIDADVASEREGWE